MQLTKQFDQHRQGRRYADVMKDARISFPAILVFFDDPDRQRRMLESELHHDGPAFAGVVRELELRDDLNEFFGKNPGHVTTRFRQTVGVVRIVMESKGWRTTGRKGSVGVRAKPESKVTMEGAMNNTGGLSVWFTITVRRVPATAPSFQTCGCGILGA